MPDKNKIIFGTNNDTYIASDDAGNIILQHEGGNRVSVTNTSITPATDEQIDLGSSTNKFKDLYLSSDSIYIGNTKLSSDPATGALSTVVADEQGQFTSPAAPVGGGASGPYDWEATGFTHFGPALTNILTTGSTGNANVDALFDKFNQIGTDVNFHDPTAIWNLTRGANPILDPAIHINGSAYGTSNESNFLPAAGQNFQLHDMGYIDPPANTSLAVDFSSSYAMHLTAPDEFDVHRATSDRYPVVLFKDENNEYFKDFLANTMLKHNLMDMVVSMEYEIIYTCSNSTTAANTPFFENTVAESDGVHRRTFTIMKFPEIVIRRKDRFVPIPDSDYNSYTGRAFPNDIAASENYNMHVLFNGVMPYSHPNATNMYTYNGSTGSEGLWRTDNIASDLTGNSTVAYSTVALSDYGSGDIDKRQADGEYYIGNMTGTLGNDINDFYWNLSSVRWSGDFFEGGICNHSDYPGSQTTTYENAGRGCETKLRIKIK
jgi:hypothetical protein